MLCLLAPPALQTPNLPPPAALWVLPCTSEPGATTSRGSVPVAALAGTAQSLGSRALVAPGLQNQPHWGRMARGSSSGGSCEAAPAPLVNFITVEAIPGSSTGPGAADRQHSAAAWQVQCCLSVTLQDSLPDAAQWAGNRVVWAVTVVHPWNWRNWNLLKLGEDSAPSKPDERCSPSTESNQLGGSVWERW